MRSENMHKTRL